MGTIYTNGIRWVFNSTLLIFSARNVHSLNIRKKGTKDIMTSYYSSSPNNKYLACKTFKLQNVCSLYIVDKLLPLKEIKVTISQ